MEGVANRGISARLLVRRSPGREELPAARPVGRVPVRPHPPYRQNSVCEYCLEAEKHPSLGLAAIRNVYVVTSFSYVLCQAQEQYKYHKRQRNSDAPPCGIRQFCLENTSSAGFRSGGLV